MVELTERDRRILDVLTRRVRLLSLSQIAGAFWLRNADPLAAARKRLAVLAKGGLVDSMTVLARPQLALAEPILTWRPGDARPDLGAAAYRLQARWTKPVGPVSVVVATAAAGHWLAGKGGRRPRTSEATHDLHLAAVYLRFLVNAPARAAGWIPEDVLVNASQKTRAGRIPDALIETASVRTAIEFGGAYSKKKLMEFHAYCDDEELAYELW